MTLLPWYLDGDKLTLNCHIQPGARHNRLAGIHDNRLKIHLQAPPVDGRANAMLIRFLARICQRPRSQVEIRRGLSSRQKTVEISGLSQVPEAFHDLVGT